MLFAIVFVLCVCVVFVACFLSFIAIVCDWSVAFVLFVVCCLCVVVC